MASIVQKKNRYYVVYLYDSEDGRRKQKWESFKTKEEAKRRKAEIGNMFPSTARIPGPCPCMKAAPV